VWLTNVLPGLREIRAPLVAGYLWLLFIYLAVYLPPRDEITGIAERAVELGEAMTPVGIAVVLSFAAYLLGSFTQWVIGGAAGVVFRAISPGGRPVGLTDRGDALLDDLVSEQVADGTVTSVEEAERLAAGIVDELDLLRTRLLSTDPALYSEVDRVNGEADLRLAVIVPLAAVAIAACFQTVDVEVAIPLILPIVLVAEALWVQGLITRRVANDKLLDALFLRRIQSPVIERWEREAASR
jgi:hypothetical protein